MSERYLKVIIIMLSVISHMAAFWQFKSFEVTETLPIDWKNFLVGLLVISLLTALVLPFCQRQRATGYLLALRGLIVFLTGQISGDYFGTEFTLLAILIVEASIYTSFRYGLSFGMLLTFLVFLSQTHYTFFGMIPRSFSWHERWGFLITALLIIGITAILRFQRENQIPAAELNRRLEEATLELAQTNMKLQEYVITAEQEAMLNERKRVAREVHDTLAYTLTNLLMMMEAAIALAEKDNPELVKHLRSARNQAKEGLAEVRYALQALRPVEYSGFSGLSAIQRLVRAFEKATQLKVVLELGDIPLYLGEEANLALFRLVQEGMTNALRHGKASLITILFSRDGEGVSVTIKDNGKGSGNPEPRSGFGLVGMQERLQRLGGRLETFSIPGEGFTLTAWIPLREE